MHKPVAHIGWQWLFSASSSQTFGARWFLTLLVLLSFGVIYTCFSFQAKDTVMPVAKRCIDFASGLVASLAWKHDSALLKIINSDGMRELLTF